MTDADRGKYSCYLARVASFLRRMRSLLRAPSAKFSSPAVNPFDQMILESLGGVSGRRISRAAALTVPNVVRGRNMLCSVSTLPLVQLDRNNRVVDNPLFRQIDLDVPNVVTLAELIEDLVFDSISWWEVTATDTDGYPMAARHREVHSVSLTPPTSATASSLAPLPSGWDPRNASVWIDGREVSASRVIRFDSPNPPVLATGAKAIRRALLLDAAASMYADDPRPLDYFTPAEGADEVDDNEVTEIIAKWRAARKQRATGWVPASLKYNQVSTPTPQQMQLVELQKQAGLDLANLFGADPEDFGISTTSRTYSNNVDRRRDRVNDVLAPYMRAVTDRLSMGDVTRRGHRVIFDLDDFLKSNPTERATVQKLYFDMGVLDRDEIRKEEGLPPKPPAPKPTVPPTPPVDDAAANPAVPGDMPEGTMTNSRLTQLQFSAATGTTGVRQLEFTASRVGFAVDAETRTIWGLAIPYNKIVSKWGMRFRFLPNSIEWNSTVSNVKFLRDHDAGQAIGYAQKLTNTTEGVQGKYKLGRKPEATAALMDAEDQIADGLSAGVEFDMVADTRWNEQDQVYDVHRAVMYETSLTPMPAFDDARVTKVAASRQGGNVMEECATCGTRHAPGVACPTPQAPPTIQPEAPEAAPGMQLSADQRRRLLDQPGVVDQLFNQLLQPQTPTEPQTQTPRAELSAEQIGALMQQRGGAQIVGALLGVPIAEPEPQRPQTVDPTRRMGATRVTEPPSYVFDRRGDLRPAKHDFGVDIIRALNPTFSDKDAEARVMEFIRAQFDVVASDVNELNPTINLPRYIDQREFAYPIFSSVNRGAPPNGVQPFSWPKFSSASGLVAVNTEGTEPASGTFVTTSQTVTPVALAGKAKISRQVWDMGGTPGLSDVLWRRITRDWYETIEARIVTALAAAGFSSLGTFTVAGGTGFTTLVAEMTKYLAQLQFARGGFRFDTAFAQADLYGHLVGAVDSAGRPLFPVLGQTNANGQARGQWSQVEIGGVPFLPAWALAAAGQVNATPSYLIDSTAVDCWATPPLRLTFDNHEVANVYVGVWGYSAEAINDTAGGRVINYDPVAP